ncbi:MAG: AEC family transporter [Erythrobacter sp.]|nr:AEC family transporter [Erythrobacter sp.]
MIGAILTALFPVFALVVLGFACEKRGWLGQGAEPALTRFVAQLSLPVLTFVTLATIDPHGLEAPALIGVALGSSFAVYALVFVVERLLRSDASSANVTALSGSYSNSAFVGLPVCLVVLGPESLGPAAVVIALNAAFVFGWAVLAGELVQHRHGGLAAGSRAALRQVGTNPLIIGAVAGVLFALLGVQMPAALLSTLQTLGSATAACALVAIGMFMARPVERVRNQLAARGLLAKLVLHPLMAFAMLGLVPDMPAVWQATLVLMAAMPTAASAYVVGVQAGERGSRIAATLIVFSTLGAMVTLPVVLAVLGQSGLVALAD